MPIGATNQPQLDHLVAGLRRGAIGQPDAIFVAILRRQYEIEQATDREARIVVQSQKGMCGIGVGAECCAVANEGVSLVPVIVILTSWLAKPPWLSATFTVNVSDSVSPAASASTAPASLTV